MNSSNRRQQKEKRRNKFSAIAGLLGTFAGKATAANTEKISLKLSAIDLGQVDLLVDQGFYFSRTDFMHAAVRNLLLPHAPTVQQAIARQLMVLGVVTHTRRSLEKVIGSRQQLDIRVVGVLRLAQDVTPELACEAIKSIKVCGSFQASPEVKAALLERME